MELQHIEISRLEVSKANMRHGRKSPDVSDILPSVRARGVLVPLLVRPTGQDSHFEIVAGRRRYHAALAANEGAEADIALPCAVLAESDDAAAIEASLIENIARQDPDEVKLWETFTRLVKAGRAVGEVAATFGISEAAVRRTLALGNLLPGIRYAYRVGDIDAATVRYLTLASTIQQKDWLALFRDPDSHAPLGQQLKAWLFGGASIAVSAALFDVQTYEGQIVADLFDDNGYFASADQFWAAQNAEIERRRARYLEDGWSAVEIIPPDRYFQSWEYERVAKRKGGRVYIDVNSRGEVSFHEGYLTHKEARKQSGGADGTDSARPARPEVTAAMNEYVERHRHAVVRSALASDIGLSLRTALAHIICGSALWHVRACDPRTHEPATAESVRTCAAEVRLRARRKTVLRSAGFDVEASNLVEVDTGAGGMVAMVRQLLALSDDMVMDLLAVAMADTLASGSELIELLGSQLGVDMADHWQADEAFFGLLRDREVLTAIMSEVAGEPAARGNASEKTATMKRVIADCLTGAHGRKRHDGWVPRWLSFPPTAYTERGGVASVAAHRVLQARLDDEPSPDERLPEAAE